MLSVHAFWQCYLAMLPTVHPHRVRTLDAFAFGDSPAMADELAALVVAGGKRATTSLPSEFATLGIPLPRVGDASVILRGDRTPVAVIELTDVQHVRFSEVDAAFAADEGEGDATLASWRTSHRAYFSRVAMAHGEPFDESTIVICQRFKLVHLAP